VVDADAVGTPAGAAAIERGQGWPGCDVVAVQPSEDAAMAWRSYSHGAIPWVPERRPRLPRRRTLPADGAAAAAVDAVRLELGDASTQAFRLLDAVVRSSGALAATAALVEVGATALDRFRRRARHPVPLEVIEAHLVRRIGELDGTHRSTWWRMTERIAFRAAHVPLEDPIAPEPGAAQVVGAFLAATTVIRFTSGRQWRRPVDLFDERSARPLAPSC
jgi:hypothetical protein